ncbi:hypothetical protein PILCRDRAFT_197052 [Piloderma croceum F 1598]|uniref:Uncharacterized protein n=1 Tax=Piloderma croceum (strain F 1598) TaxID=765440 RepID=A0A0C3GDP1_PILCF|nr:hypothetical protein PILCRDRAFT_197052 [Piloderma croceum F 1598]
MDVLPSQPITFDMLSGALRISTKYEISALREWCIQELRSRWPREIETMGTTSLPHAAEAISLARECDVPDILPAAFYALSVQKWSCLADGGRSHVVLHPSDLRRLIAGREGLQDILVRCIINPLGDALVCSTCRPLIERFWRTKLAPDPMSPWGCWLLRELQQMTPGDAQYYANWCANCAFQHHCAVWDQLRRLKETIPRLFLLT